MIILSYCLFAVASCWHFCLFVFHDCYTTCISIKPGTHKKCNGIEFVLSNLDSYPYYYIQLGETQNISFFPIISFNAGKKRLFTEQWCHCESVRNCLYCIRLFYSIHLRYCLITLVSGWSTLIGGYRGWQ